jgi:hypothetical protein
MVSSFLTLPVELVYRILDNLNDQTIFLSLINVCTRLNTIINTYDPYKVNFSFYFWTYFTIIFETLFILKESHIRPFSLFCSVSTKEKINANRIFDLEYRVCDQKKFSWIYMNSTSTQDVNSDRRKRRRIRPETAIKRLKSCRKRL